MHEETLREYANNFVPEDASNIVAAPSIPWIQISFDVRREPLEFAISADRLDRAKAEGWTVCQPSTADWTGYYDAKVTPRRYTQNRAYVLYKDGVLIELIGVYYSDSEATSVQKSVGSAAGRVQHGMVIARNATEKEVVEAADVLGVSCH